VPGGIAEDDPEPNVRRRLLPIEERTPPVRDGP